MRLLVFGKTGQVARELQRLPHDVTALDRHAADLTDPKACAAIIRTAQADAVINAAAYTAVDRAENEEPLATLINATTPGAMATACAARALPFLHVSTDYVFDGSGTAPWRPTDPVSPINAYGRSKLAGEQAVQAAGGRAAILRTSWVFSAHGNNFVKTMLRLSETRDLLSIVSDQIGGPTPARGIAETLATMAQAMITGQGGGIYHYAGQPATSWACFARETFALAERATQVTDIPSADYPTPARRPLNSRLDCASLEADFGITPANWKAALAEVVNEVSA